MKLQDYLNNIENKLHRSFDIYRDYLLDDYKYDLFAEHHLRTEKYFLTRKTVIDAMESNEYCFIKYFTKLDKDELKRFTDTLIKSIDTLINLNEGHMSSIITGVMVLDENSNKDIIDMVEKFKFHKGFAFGFKGWVDIRLILVTMNQNHIVANKKGREVLEVYSI